MSLRQKVYEKSNGHCWYCGCELPERWHIDHFKPVKRRNGKMENPKNDNFENIVPSCPPCNRFKGSFSIEMFRYGISNLINSLNRDVSIYRHAKRYGLVEETGKEVEFWFEKNR